MCLCSEYGGKCFFYVIKIYIFYSNWQTTKDGGKCFYFRVRQSTGPAKILSIRQLWTSSWIAVNQNTKMPKCWYTLILILCLTNYKSSLLDTKDANRVLNTIFLIFLKKALPEPRKDSGSFTVPYKYMPQAGFEPGTYGILSAWIWDSALHSVPTAGYSIIICIAYQIWRHIVVFTELKTGPNVQLNETYQSNIMRLMNEEKTSQWNKNKRTKGALNATEYSMYCLFHGRCHGIIVIWTKKN